jgi:hypothetical protein
MSIAGVCLTRYFSLRFQKMNFAIPEGLSEMLRDFTVAVLRSRPSDLYQFAAEYFSKSSAANRNNVGSEHSTGGDANGTGETTMSNSVDQQQNGNGNSDGDEARGGGSGGGGGGAKVVPMYIVVDDDNEAREPDKTELKPKTSRQHRYGRRHSVSAERYDPEADDDTDENKVRMREQKRVKTRPDEPCRSRFPALLCATRACLGRWHVEMTCDFISSRRVCIQQQKFGALVRFRARARIAAAAADDDEKDDECLQGDQMVSAGNVEG